MTANKMNTTMLRTVLREVLTARLVARHYGMKPQLSHRQTLIERIARLRVSDRPIDRRWLEISLRHLAEMEPGQVKAHIADSVIYVAWLEFGLETEVGTWGRPGHIRKHTLVSWYGGLRFSFNSEHIGSLGRDTDECPGLYVHRFLGQTWTH